MMVILQRRFVNNSKCSLLHYQGQNVIAYAQYCHQDQNSRPISGLVNVCPELLTSSDVDSTEQQWLVENFLFVHLIVCQTKLYVSHFETRNF